MTTKTKGLAPPKSASELLDMYYLEARSHLLETAAILDRIERGAGSPAAMADPRIQKLFDACDILKDQKTNRAEQFLKALSV